MLGAGEAARAGQRDVDGLGLERGIGRGIGRTRAFEQRLHKFFENFEALAHGLFRWPGRGFEPPVRDFVEQALLAPQPLEPERLRVERRGACAGLRLERGKRLVERGLVKSVSAGAVRLGMVFVRHAECSG